MPSFLKNCCFALLFACAFNSHAAAIGLEIEGLSKPLTDNVRASLDWHTLDSGKVSSAYLQRRLQKSEATVAKALEPFGYYHPEITSQLKQDGEQWLAFYQITPGPITRVKQLNIQLAGAAANDPAFSQAQQTFPLQAGDALSHQRYESGKANISKKLTAQGYLDASLKTARIAVNKSRREADIALHWQSGPAYRFGELSSSTEHIDARLIQRWAKFNSGERFSYEKLLAFQQRLDSSGYFQHSEIAIDTQPSDGTADISVITEPAAKRLYRASLGYGTDTGARAQLGFEQRWLNRFGHSLRSGIRLAEREQSYSLSYQVPALRGRADSYHYGWQRRDQQLPEYDSRSDRFSASQLSNTRSWQILWGINIESDQFTVANQRQSEQLWYLENQWSKYRSDKPVYPSRANSLIINGRVGAGFDSEQKYFSRLHLQQQWIRPAPWPGRVILRGAAGALWSDSFDRLPPQHRFYSGGDRSVRGYAYQSLSPTDGSNQRIGGRYLAELSGELDYRFNENWAAAFFVDAGQAFNFSDTDLAIGTGLGARFITSLLVVRIDVANAINQENKPWRLHLTLGTDF
jgi:translocation and assembly module TamA